MTVFFEMAGYDSNRYMSSCRRVKVYGSDLRVPKMNKQERARREKERRDKIMQEALDFRLLNGWLVATYPDTITGFVAFKKKLKERNPLMKDLTKSVMFQQFIRDQTGTDCLDYVSVNQACIDCEFNIFFRLCEV